MLTMLIVNRASSCYSQHCAYSNRHFAQHVDTRCSIFDVRFSIFDLTAMWIHDVRLFDAPCGYTMFDFTAMWIHLGTCGYTMFDFHMRHLWDECAYSDRYLAQALRGHMWIHMWIHDVYVGTCGYTKRLEPSYKHVDPAVQLRAPRCELATAAGYCVSVKQTTRGTQPQD